MLTRLLAVGRAMRSRWRQSFVMSITAIALVAVALFALVIARIVANQIEDQAIDRARDTASIIARASFAPRLPPAGKRLAAPDRADLDRQVAAARAVDPGLGMRLWSRRGTVIYDAGPDARGSAAGAAGGRAAAAGPDAATRAALAGRPATNLHRDGTTDTSADAALISAIPVRRTPGGPVEAALELRLPYAPVGQDIRDRTRRLYVALLVAALIAYALALPALIRAGRAVRAQYDPRRLALLRDLRRGMAHDELVLYFHPIADASSGEVHTAEALIRWRHPTRGLISPDRFIPIVEPTELMWDLTLHIFGLVARQARVWEDEGVSVRIAVNVSSVDVIDPRLPGDIGRLLREHGAVGDRLEIEVTEGAVMSDPKEALQVLARLSSMGLGVIAIDDFGTGYSSLARLHELPLDELKIDQSFVMRMARDGDETLVRSIIELAHALGLKVIAEGVEAHETWRRLTELGADYVQGYVLTRPLPAAEFADWLKGASRATVP